MSTEVRHRRGTTAQHAAFTGALAEITVDTDKKTAVVHDGGTAGGFPLAREDQKNDGALGYQQDVKTNDYGVVVGDIGKMVVANKATAINFALGTAASLTSKFVVAFKNVGAGTLTITPNGAELIDGVNAAISVPTGMSLILKGDGASFRTFVSNADVTATAIHNAAAKTALVAADEIGFWDSVSSALRKITYSNFLATLDSALFTLISGTKKMMFDLSAVTNGQTRKIKMADGDIDLANMGIKQSGTITFSGTSFDITGLIPPNAKRVTLLFNTLSTNAAAALVQLGTSGGVVTTGYVADVTVINTAATVAVNATTTGHLLGAANASNNINGAVVFENMGGNIWQGRGLTRIIGSSLSQHVSIITLSGTLDRIRVTTTLAANAISGTCMLTVEF